MRGFARLGCIRANDPVDALHHFSRVPRCDDTRPCSFLDCTVTRMGNSANDSKEQQRNSSRTGDVSFGYVRLVDFTFDLRSDLNPRLKSSIGKWQKRDFFYEADRHRNDAQRSYVFTWKNGTNVLQR